MASFVTNYITLLSAMFVCKSSSTLTLHSHPHSSPLPPSLVVGVAFSVPWLYSQFQSQIDSHLDSVVSKLGAFSKRYTIYSVYSLSCQLLYFLFSPLFRVLSYVPIGGGGGKKKTE